MTGADAQVGDADVSGRPDEGVITSRSPNGVAWKGPVSAQVRGKSAGAEDLLARARLPARASIRR